MSIFIKSGMFIGKIMSLCTLGLSMWVFSGILSSIEYLLGAGIRNTTDRVLINILSGIAFIPRNIRECITDPCARWTKRQIAQSWNNSTPRTRP